MTWKRTAEYFVTDDSIFMAETDAYRSKNSYKLLESVVETVGDIYLKL